MSGFYVYILASGRNKTLYFGMSGNLERRVQRHKKGVASVFTTRYEVKKLLYYEKHNDIEKAQAREKQLKKWNRKWKLQLIEKVNPSWKDLYSDIIDLEQAGSPLKTCGDKKISKSNKKRTNP